MCVLSGHPESPRLCIPFSLKFCFSYYQDICLFTSSVCSPATGDKDLFIFFFNFLFFLNFNIFNSYMRSQTWTPLPPPSPQHLPGSSPCTSPKHAAPYVRHGLAIQFLHDSIHVRIPILPNHPTLSLSLWVQKSIIHICVFFPVLHTGSSLPSS